MYPLKLVHDLRPVLPWSIYALPISIPAGPTAELQQRRIAVRWDDDNDERVLGALLAAYYQRPKSVWNVYAIAERKGALTVWALIMDKDDEGVWRNAVRSQLLGDIWTVDVIDATVPQDNPDLEALMHLFSVGPISPGIPWE